MNATDRIQAWEKQAKKEPGTFQELMKEVFHTNEGQRLLAALCHMWHPLEHSFVPDARLAEHEAGAREVVAALWRYGATQNKLD